MPSYATVSDFQTGIGCLVGVNGLYSFFFKTNSFKTSLIFFAGVALVFLKFPIFGMCLEFYGLLKLFRKFLPVIVKFLYGVPLIGWFFWLPGVNKVVQWLSEPSNSMV